MVRRYTTATMADFLNDVAPFTVGFDKVLDNIANVSDIAHNYPPYNIVKNDDESFVIELAAAGFRKDEFNIQHVPHNGNKLIVQGVQDRGEDKRDFVHKGIGARNFTRSFALSDDVVVDGAKFEDGMLLISLKRVIPEEKKAKEIKVK